MKSSIKTSDLIAFIRSTFQKKQGYGAANNIATQSANCDYLIFMNDDIILKPDCLEKMLSVLKEMMFRLYSLN